MRPPVPIAVSGIVEDDPHLTQSERFLHFRVVADRVERDGVWAPESAAFACTVFGPSAPLFAHALVRGQRVIVQGRTRPPSGPLERVAVGAVSIVKAGTTTVLQ